MADSTTITPAASISAKSLGRRVLRHTPYRVLDQEHGEPGRAGVERRLADAVVGGQPGYEDPIHPTMPEEGSQVEAGHLKGAVRLHRRVVGLAHQDGVHGHLQTRAPFRPRSALHGMGGPGATLEAGVVREAHVVGWVPVARVDPAAEHGQKAVDDRDHLVAFRYGQGTARAEVALDVHHDDGVVRSDEDRLGAAGGAAVSGGLAGGRAHGPVAWLAGRFHPPSISLPSGRKGRSTAGVSTCPSSVW